MFGKKKKSLLFYSKAPMNYVMFQRVADRLRAEGRVRVFLYAEGNADQDIPAVYGPLGVPREDIIPWRRARFGRFNLFVCADAWMSRHRCRRSAHIFHGISFKGKAFKPNMREYDRLFLFGEYHRRRFIEKGIFTDGDPRMAMIGMMKANALFDGSLNKAELQKRFGVDPAKPTILYAPTWSSRSSFFQQGNDIIDIVSRLDVNFLVKLHDLTVWPMTGGAPWPARMRKLQEAGKQFHFVTELNVMPLLYISDLLISDASSVANEFTLLDRPIIFMDVPELFEKYRASLDLETWGRRTGYVVEDLARLEGVIRYALANPDEHGEIRRAAAADYFYDPGRATERAVKEIYRLLDEE